MRIMRIMRFTIPGLIFLCSSCGFFLQNTATKNFKDPVTRTKEYQKLNRFQQDFIYLKTVCNKYFPLADKYFPKDKRLALEKLIFEKLNRTSLTDLEFRLYLRTYLSNFNNQHTWASLKGISGRGIYPFIPFNQDSSWYILNTLTNVDRNFIGRKILSFNDIPLNQYEQKLFSLVSAENTLSKRKDLLSWWYRPTFHEFIKGQSIDSIKLGLDSNQTLALPKITSGQLKWHLSDKDFKQHPITKPKDR